MWKRAGPLVQRLYDWRMTIPRTAAEHVKLRVAERMLWIARALGDPLVRYPIASFPLLFPLSHRMPWYVRAYAEHSRNLGRIAGHVAEKYPDLSVIDIGANVGDSVAILRNAGEFPILAVEGDSFFFEILRLNTEAFMNVELANAFVGDAAATIRGEVLRKDGTARIRLDGAAAGQVAIEPLCRVVRDHPRFAAAKLLKIDTDGLDGTILRGACDFLARARPVIFFEYEPSLFSAQGDDGLSLFQYLDELGYGELMVYDYLGYLMFTCRVCDARTLEQLHVYLCSNRRIHSCDLCAFPAEDTDLCGRIQRAEIAYFAARGGCQRQEDGRSIDT